MINTTFSVKFIGPYAEILQLFVSNKNASGYKYETASKMLMHFDHYCNSLDKPVPAIPDKNIIESYMQSQPHLSATTKNKMLTTFRQLALFLNGLNYEAYHPPFIKGTVNSSFAPYIFTKEEIERFFISADNIQSKANTPYMHIVLPTLFRMLYGCGLRINEAVNLENKDVDLENGILILHKTKYGKERLVPMSDSLADVCRIYAENEIILLAKSKYFFPAPDRGHVSVNAVRGRFKELLFKSGISYHGQGKGPRLHDLRHTFAVHCLHEWATSGKDIQVALPLLSSYLGHEYLTATGKYLRLTADVYPEITERMAQLYNTLFTEVTPYETD